ncbi:MAG: DNA repair protein RadA, partial [Arthrobacter sp.]|nr:DNA repair protein RadA [Arthrobacter sp.]
LLAVLQQRAGCQLHKDDSYVATVGGVKLSEPATDLAVALAVASAKAGKALSSRLIAFGEVGLAGEVRPVPGINKRIQEASRLGFTHAIVPSSPNGPGPVPDGFTVKEVEHLAQALELLFHG